MDAVSGERLKQVHDDLAVSPRVHEERVEPDLVAGHAEPEQMAVHAFQFADQGADVLGTLGDLDAHQFLNALHETGGVGVRADAADALHEVDVLDVATALRQLLDAAVVVAEAKVGVDDELAVDFQAERRGFLQRRVLWSDGDGVRTHLITSVSRSYCQSFRSG